jgi:hypothetical protein
MALTRIMRRAPSRAQKEEAIDQMLSWIREDEMSPPRLLLTGSAILCGVYPSKYCVRPDVNQLREAASLNNRAVVNYVAAAQKLDGYPKFYCLCSSVLAGRIAFTYCAIIGGREWSTLLPQEGQILLELSEMYLSNFRNYHGRWMTGSKWDPNHNTGLGSPVFLVKYGNIPTAQAEQAKWEGIDVEVKAIGAETPLFAAYLVWPFLELEVGCLDRVCQVWGVDWANAASWAANQANHAMGYTYTDGEGNCVTQLDQASLQVRKMHFECIALRLWST